MKNSDVQILQLPFHSDERGDFTKIYHTSNEILSNFNIEQVNHVSSAKFTLRGLHYQTGEHAESKFFRVLKGSVQLVFLCIDNINLNYKKSYSFILEPHETGILIPEGYATGYLTLADDTEVLYLSNKKYAPTFENGIRWDDPVIKVTWLAQNPLLSEKDSSWTTFISK